MRNPFASRPKTGSRRISYAGIAAALAVNKPMLHDYAYLTWKATVLSVADVLAARNVKFDRKRFLLAAGAL